jgi:hypothetical protein
VAGASPFRPIQKWGREKRRRFLDWCESVGEPDANASAGW